MTEKPEASVLTARRAAQHFRLSSADDACEHLYVLIIRSSLGPSPPHAGRYTVASRFRRRSYERGYIFQGLQNSSLPPRSALWATCDGTHGLIEFLLSRQSFSAAFQVALRVADQPPSGMIRPRVGTNSQRQRMLLLDSLGDLIYIPSSSRRGGFRGQTSGPSARHSGHADP